MPWPWAMIAGVDADHLPLHIEQRSAAVPGVDRCIGLQKIIVRTGADNTTPLAPIMPVVTVCPNPNGLPTAMTQSPTRIASEITQDQRFGKVAIRG